MKGNTFRSIFAGSIAVTLIIGILATSMSIESFAQQVLLNGAGSTFHLSSHGHMESRI